MPFGKFSKGDLIGYQEVLKWVHFPDSGRLWNSQPESIERRDKAQVFFCAFFIVEASHLRANSFRSIPGTFGAFEYQNRLPSPTLGPLGGVDIATAARRKGIARMKRNSSSLSDRQCWIISNDLAYKAYKFITCKSILIKERDIHFVQFTVSRKITTGIEFFDFELTVFSTDVDDFMRSTYDRDTAPCKIKVLLYLS